MHRKTNELIEGDDNGFTYERGSIILKGYFFQEPYQINSHVNFQVYQPNVISCQYSYLVCATYIKLIEVQSKKILKVKKWKMTKSDHE